MLDTEKPIRAGYRLILIIKLLYIVALAALVIGTFSLLSLGLMPPEYSRSHVVLCLALCAINTAVALVALLFTRYFRNQLPRLIAKARLLEP